MEKAMEYILKIHECKSVSKAAEQLFISQPALSNILKKEEDKYGVTLFDRNFKPIILTKDGEKYIHYAMKIKSLESSLKRDLRKSSTSLTIGSSAFFCSNVLPGLIHDFLTKTKYKTKIQVVEGNASTLVSKFNSGDLDFVITVDSNYGKKAHFTELKKELLILAAPIHMFSSTFIVHNAIPSPLLGNPYMILDRSPKLSLREFIKYPFILLSKGNDMYYRAHKMFRNIKCHPTKVIYMDQLQSAYLAAKSGQGITFIRADLLNFMDTSDLCFFQIEDPLSIREVKIFYKSLDSLSDAGQTFFNFCLNEFASI